MQTMVVLVHTEIYVQYSRIWHRQKLVSSRVGRHLQTTSISSSGGIRNIWMNPDKCHLREYFGKLIICRGVGVSRAFFLAALLYIYVAQKSNVIKDSGLVCTLVFNIPGTAG